MSTPYSQKFSLDKNFAKPSYLSVAKILSGINFANAVKVAISSMQSLILDQKITIKFSSMRAGGEIGENFLLV